MTCGTFQISYDLRDAPLSVMQLSGILAQQKLLPVITFDDHVRPSFDTMLKINQHGFIHIIETLFDSQHFIGFNHFTALRSSSDLTHEAVCPPPSDHLTVQYPGQSITIPESSVSDIIKVIEDIYYRQKDMHASHEIICDYVVLSINDQSTNSLLRSARVLRSHDNTPFTRFDSIQLAPGMFHFLLNLAWNMLEIHRGHGDNNMSIQSVTTELNKKHHGGKHRDYHAVKATLMQTLDGLLLEAW